jgi:hypothetical protein
MNMSVARELATSDSHQFGSIFTDIGRNTTVNFCGHSGEIYKPLDSIKLPQDGDSICKTICRAAWLQPFPTISLQAHPQTSLRTHMTCVFICWLNNLHFLSLRVDENSSFNKRGRSKTTSCAKRLRNQCFCYRLRVALEHIRSMRRLMQFRGNLLST